MAELDPNARVTAEQVRDLISTTLTDARVNAMINTAHLVVEQRLSGKGVEASVLKQIELWLSAHFVSLADPRKKQVKIDEVTVTYATPDSSLEGLRSTTFGQQALALDPTNSLASTALKKAVMKAE